mmetsp:Transcript_23762/g.50747  ORF Transcript_23762/g.50747 Transcript_23762/m.50747 type:complete len:198 (+) Transcript_23762:140-733(+)
MPLPAGFSGPVYAYQTFHVRLGALPEFCEVVSALMKASKNDPGLMKMDLHRELPWAQSLSNDEFSLFLMVQEWSNPLDLEKHVTSAHAVRFGATLPRLLVVEPSVSIFGSELTLGELATLSTAAATPARVQSSGGYPEADDAIPPTTAPNSVASGLSSSLRSTNSGTRSQSASNTALPRSNSRSSVLSRSGAATLRQ